VRQNSQKSVLLKVGLLKSLNLAAFTQVTSDFQKSAQQAVFSPERRDKYVAPKLGPIFSDSPALLCKFAVLCCDTKYLAGPVTLKRFPRIKNRKVFTDNFLSLVSFDAFGSCIPADDVSLGVEKKNSIILYPRNQGVEMLLALQDGNVCITAP
jgi:hypothetical protein